MAYTPTVWVKGDKVTSAKLNKIENGIADKVDKVNGKVLSTNDYTNGDKKKVDDISISSPTNGQALVYNSSTQKWENKTISGGSGQDGYSPTITVTNITGGHRVSITDATGTQTFDVMDGTSSGGSSGDAFTQWNGKTWYAYGTSITNIASEGRYATYLAQMSGMTLVNKGISGGGIGDFGSYSTGQVYDAICNVTDGKLNADLITLETGANDVDAGVNVPLGTVYDTGTSTLAGCLNDCLRYLQDHTSAQIVVIPSPASAYEDPHSANVQKYYEWAKMVEEICFINRVSFINSNNNMGYAKLASNDGSLYTPDGVHHTDLGGRIFARHIWYQLRNIPVFESSQPSPSSDWETKFDGSVTMEAISDEWSTYKGAYITNYPEQLVEGDSYRVTYNGTQYLCTVVEDPYVYVDYLGNTQWSGGSTSPNQEPFCILNEGNNTVSVFTDEPVGTTITLKIEKSYSPQLL